MAPISVRTIGPFIQFGDVVAVNSVSVSPDPAPAGTTRTLTVIATSSLAMSLTFDTPVASGITFTPVGGQPPGQAQWTFVY